MTSAYRFSEDISRICRMKQGMLASAGHIGDKSYNLLGIVAATGDYVASRKWQFPEEYVRFVESHRYEHCTKGNCTALLSDPDVQRFVTEVVLEDSSPVEMPVKMTNAYDFVNFFLITDREFIEELKNQFGVEYIDKLITIGNFISYKQVMRLVNVNHGGPVHV